MNKNFISEFSSSLSNHGLTIGDKTYPVAVSPIEMDGDMLSFSVWCRKPNDREVKFLKFEISDMKARSTVEETVLALEKTINEEY